MEENKKKGGYKKIHEHEKAGSGNFRVNPQNAGRRKKLDFLKAIQEEIADGSTISEINVAYKSFMQLLPIADEQAIKNICNNIELPLSLRTLAKNYLNQLKAKHDTTQDLERILKMSGMDLANQDALDISSVVQIFVGDTNIKPYNSEADIINKYLPDEA